MEGPIVTIPVWVQLNADVLTLMPCGGLSVPVNNGVPPYVCVPETPTGTGIGATVKSLAAVV